eukprot:10576820-Prorocentrum_lima.AAC.1
MAGQLSASDHICVKCTLATLFAHRMELPFRTVAQVALTPYSQPLTLPMLATRTNAWSPSQRKVHHMDGPAIT